MAASKATARRKDKRKRARERAKAARETTCAAEPNSNHPVVSRKRRPTYNSSKKVLPNTLVSNVVVHGDKGGGFGVFATASVRCTINTGVVTYQTAALKSPRSLNTLADLENEVEVYWQLKGLPFVPLMYGVLHNHPDLPDTPTTIVMEEGQVPLAKLWRGVSTSCAIHTSDCMNRPETAGPLLRKVLGSLLVALKMAHLRNVCHGDLKMSNLVCRVKAGTARPVVSYDALELLLIDWGMNLHGSWKTGTRPCSMKTWFSVFPGRQIRAVEQKRGADFFQAIMVVVTMMLKGCPSPVSSTKGQTGPLRLGGSWLATRTQLNSRCVEGGARSGHNVNHMQGWLYFLMFHPHTVCGSPFHTDFCTHLQPYQMHYHSVLRTYDVELSRLFMYGV